jgi:mannose-6-phosphate isomerase-like protein (cupin superfamily)
MKYFNGNIEALTLENTFFRKVIFTAKHSQLVLMSLKPGEEIGEEVHTEDQFFRLEQGSAKFIIDGEVTTADASDAVVVPASSEHNVINVGNEDLKLYTIYSPAHH